MGKQLTPEEILNKHLRNSDDIWELSDLKNAMIEFSDQNNKAKNETIEKVIRQRDSKQSRIEELEANESEVERIAAIILKGDLLSEYRQQKSRIAELESENAELVTDRNMYKTAYGHAGEELTESEQLNEKLMGELKKQIRWMYTQDHWAKDEVTEDEYWQSYCKEKGLTPNKTEPRDYTIDDFT